MDAEQFKIFLEQNDKSTARAIEKHVNGHLRDMDKKLQDHIDLVSPYIVGLEGSKTVGRIIMWIGGIIITIGGSLAVVKNFFTH